MPTLQALSLDTQTIQAELSRLAPGEVISYDALSERLGRDVRNGARGCLTTAMRRLLADGIVFGCVRGEGVKRLTNDEIVGCGGAALARVRRAARRTAAKLAAVDYGALPTALKTEHNLALSMMGALLHATRPSVRQQLAARIEEAQAALPLQKTLDALRA